MDDLCFKIDLVLNECSKFLCNLEIDNSIHGSIFKVSLILYFTFNLFS